MCIRDRFHRSDSDKSLTNGRGSWVVGTSRGYKSLVVGVGVGVGESNIAN